MTKIPGTPSQLLARRKWVDALRSGNYKQTRGVLRGLASQGFCCLGVACDVSGITKWIYGTYDGAAANLPPSVVEWLGVEKDGRFYTEIPENKARNLVTLNDAFGYDFNKIADLIEEKWEVAPAT
jgi:hypothetical protein